MTPKEKSRELFDRFMVSIELSGVRTGLDEWAKVHALICVEEIIQPLETLHKAEYTTFIAKEIYTIADTEYDTHINGYELINYWQEVKSELEKIKT